MWIPFGRPGAIARIAGSDMFPQLYGSVKFYQFHDAVLVTADITGLPQSDTDIFALHIHDGDQCFGKDFANTGSHYNPNHTSHPMHTGDLPPLFSCKGRAYMEMLTCRFKLKDVIGKTVVIHDNPDDFKSQPAGNSGKKIACGVIARV